MLLSRPYQIAKNIQMNIWCKTEMINYFDSKTFQEICLAAYRGVVQPESEDKRIISAQWAKDEDIARLLR